MPGIARTISIDLSNDQLRVVLDALRAQRDYIDDPDVPYVLDFLNSVLEAIQALLDD